MSVAVVATDTGGVAHGRGARWLMAGLRVPQTSSVPDGHLCGLIESVARGRDRAAFAELFRYFAPRLRAFGIKRGSDPETAEELAQEAMLTVWRKAETFDRQRATASTWIFTIVRNKRIDLFRCESRPELDPGDLYEDGINTNAPDQELQAGQVATVLGEAIRTLPAEQEQILRMAFFEDKTHREIAAELDLPLDTVKSRVRLALARIRESLSEDDL